MSDHINRNETGRRVEASVKVYLTWDTDEDRWVVDGINADGHPLDFAYEPELVDEDGSATDADLDAAMGADVFADDLLALLAEALA